MNRNPARILASALALGCCLVTQTACRSTLGAEGVDPMTEGNADAMEDEESEEVFESINR